MRIRVGHLGAMGLFLFTACAGPSSVVQPTDFAFHARQDVFDLAWSIERAEGNVRAVGRVDAGSTAVAGLTLELFGLDASGRIASRGQGVVRWRFAPGPEPFVIELVPTGAEERFVVQVGTYVLSDFRTGGGR